MLVEGKAYSTLINEAEGKAQSYGEDSQDCIHNAVIKLMDNSTTADRPGMLLGMVQSGKTKTFLGIIGLALDNGFNLFIVLTKGTKALATQTIERLKQAFHSIIDDEDQLRVFDVMALPKLTPFEQGLPMIIVAKKEKNNLNRLSKAILEDFPKLTERRVLIIDDEADFASIGFRRTKTETIEAQRIMQLIDYLRQRLPNASLLETTATPYSLYLQPPKLPTGSAEEFKPLRPAFTVLVPTHKQYIGGKYYFEDSLIPESVASYLYCPVDTKELDILHHSDGRRLKLEMALTSNSIVCLRQAIVTFLVGGIIRRLQAEHAHERKGRFSFIIHTESKREAHQWQENIVEAIVERLREAASAGTEVFGQLISSAYADLSKSVVVGGFYLPSEKEVLAEVAKHLPAIQIEKVNSEQDINKLLDQNGQLELRNPLNVFIGGQILDRGITVANLIGFYYGRRASKFQQDTVLQHSRMYGFRPVADLAVTRFYTSPEIYRVLKTIHEFDSALRNELDKGGNDAGVIFIQQDGNRLIPCSPNKILLSTLTTVQPGKRILPIGFQTGPKTKILRIINQIDAFIDALLDPSNKEEPVLVNLQDANRILDLISNTLIDEEDSGYEWNVAAVKACLCYVSREIDPKNAMGKVYLLVRRNRHSSRMRPEGNRFFDAPDTGKTEGILARKLGEFAPVLVLLRQEGAKEQGWLDCPFWWPVIYMPQNMKTVVFASDTLDIEQERSEDE